MHSYKPDDLHGAPASVLDSRASSFIDLDPHTGQFTATASIYHDSILALRFDPVKLQAKIKAFEDDRTHRRTLVRDDFDYTRLRQIPPAEAINQAPLIDDFGISDADYPLWWWELNWHPKPKSKSIAYRKHRLACFLAMLEDRDRRAKRLLSLNLLSLNLLAITSMLWLQSKGAPLETPVTVTGHPFRFCYAVTLSPVTVTGHPFRYCYAVTLSPVFLRVCAPPSSEPRPLATQQLPTCL